MRYEIHPSAVREAAWEEGFAVTQAEAADWLRRHRRELNRCLDLEVREFLSEQMGLDFPEPRLREIADRLIDAWTLAAEHLPEAGNRTVHTYGFDNDAFLRACKTIARKCSPEDTIEFEFRYEGDQEERCASVQFTLAQDGSLSVNMAFRKS